MLNRRVCGARIRATMDGEPLCEKCVAGITSERIDISDVS